MIWILLAGSSESQNTSEKKTQITIQPDFGARIGSKASEIASLVVCSKVFAAAIEETHEIKAGKVTSLCAYFNEL